MNNDREKNLILKIATQVARPLRYLNTSENWTKTARTKRIERWTIIVFMALWIFFILLSPFYDYSYGSRGCESIMGFGVVMAFILLPVWFLVLFLLLESRQGGRWVIGYDSLFFISSSDHYESIRWNELTGIDVMKNHIVFHTSNKALDLSLDSSVFGSQWENMAAFINRLIGIVSYRGIDTEPLEVLRNRYVRYSCNNSCSHFYNTVLILLFVLPFFCIVRTFTEGIVSWEISLARCFLWGGLTVVLVIVVAVTGWIFIKWRLVCQGNAMYYKLAVFYAGLSISDNDSCNNGIVFPSILPFDRIQSVLSDRYRNLDDFIERNGDTPRTLSSDLLNNYFFPMEFFHFFNFILGPLFVTIPIILFCYGNTNDALKISMIVFFPMLVIFGLFILYRIRFARRLIYGKATRAEIVNRRMEGRSQKYVIYDAIDSNGLPVTVDVRLSFEMMAQTKNEPESRTVLVFYLPNAPKSPSVFLDGADSLFNDEITGRIETRYPVNYLRLTLFWYFMMMILVAALWMIKLF